MDQPTELLPVDALAIIGNVLQAQNEEITNVALMKKGMTNHSFSFECHGKKYMIRIAGEGTDRLINRKQEYEVYQKIVPLHISDELVYLDPDRGYKITEYLEQARVCDAANKEDVRICMGKLRGFHEKNLRVSHTFDIFGQICRYESLWEGVPSCFPDYIATRDHIFELVSWLGQQEKHWTLAHIDAVSDNFLFLPGGEVRLIDWEYAGMQDACVDIAMFAIYAMYERREVEALIDAYYPEGCTAYTRLKIYGYIACCGLLWSNWCEFKRKVGAEFGAYALRQYRYAKEYYHIFEEERKGR